MSSFIQYLANGLSAGSLYAAIALGMVIIHNVTRVPNLAQGDFAMLGAMFTFALTRAGVPIVLAIPLAVVITAFLSAMFYQLGIRPIIRSAFLVLVVATIGASGLFEGSALLAVGTDAVPSPAELTVPPIVALGATVQPQQLLLFFAVLATAGATAWFFHSTLLGRALFGCSDNAIAARLCGINPTQMGVAAFALGAAVTAVGGAFAAPLTAVTWSMGALLTLKGFTAAVIAGFSNVWGAVIAGFALGVVESLGAAYVLSSFSEAIAFVLLVAALLVRAFPIRRWLFRFRRRQLIPSP